MAQFHFKPDDYLELMHSDVPAFDEFEDRVAESAAVGATRILELGTGSGETSRRVLASNPDARLVGIDLSDEMLNEARRALPEDRIENLAVGAIQDALPDGPFDLVVSALAVHHLRAVDKAELFRRTAAVLAPGGRFVLGDVVIPMDPADAVTPCTPDFDFPSPLSDQLAWLEKAGFHPEVTWQHKDLAVIRADLD
jgi:tRNA (cmo5U34)-methyltransferase